MAQRHINLELMAALRLMLEDGLEPADALERARVESTTAPLPKDIEAYFIREHPNPEAREYALSLWGLDTQGRAIIPADLVKLVRDEDRRKRFPWFKRYDNPDAYSRAVARRLGVTPPEREAVSTDKPFDVKAALADVQRERARRAAIGALGVNGNGHAKGEDDGLDEIETEIADQYADEYFARNGKA